MAQISAQLSTGLPGLDRVLKGLIPGDNVVWQVSSVNDYRPFVRPCCENALARGQPLIYFRFAKHEPLVSTDLGATVYPLQPEAGFEAFVTDIHKVIAKTGRGGVYIFDCLSDLAADWYSDQMLGNFFRLTCPYLYDVEAIAYFAVLRNHHSPHATGAIGGTAQVLLDVYQHKDHLYVHPLKVQQRHSPTMYMLHAWEGDEFLPVKESAATSEVLTGAPWPGQDADWQLGVWNQAFLQAEQVLEVVQRSEAPPEKAREHLRRLLRMAVSRDERILQLLEKHLGLADVLQIRKRMIGTGLVGGKSVGMLLARAILRQADKRWTDLLEAHDSFYVGSDVFYTFLVQNGVWWVREKQKDPATFLEGAERARHRMLTGSFPDEIIHRFEQMLDYFGQSPIIVRSSSLLEDNFGNSFAGKYESVFCANQGSRDKRLEDFLSAVRTVYSSAMSERALRYRARRGILDRDEQMALLVQRVSGALYGNFFYPPVAGVGFSFNPYVWSEYIDPHAGMLRLVLGLGTRAVNRSDDDYTRVVALNAPERRPEAKVADVRRYAQRKVDILDLEANQLVSLHVAELVGRSPGLPLEWFVSRDEELLRRAEQSGVRDVFPWFVTFEKLFTQGAFVRDMRDMLAVLQHTYDYPVDIEFTANFSADGRYKINLVQCRPLQVKEGLPIQDPPADLRPDEVVLETQGAVIGQGRATLIDRLIYVVPDAYQQLSIGDRYAVARLIGRLVHLQKDDTPGTLMLLGPGRWGTTTPSLGVPVSFADINDVSIIGEIVTMGDGVTPDVSLGTHFLNDLIEMDILYLALFPGHADNRLNETLLKKAANRLTDLVPDAAPWAHVVRVIEPADLSDGGVLRLNANTLKQKVVCYLERTRT